MASSVCAACRDSKVKCELLERSDGLSQRCARCTRIGLICEPARPSQRGRHSSKSRLGGQNKRRLDGASRVDGGSDADNALAADGASVVEFCSAAGSGYPVVKCNAHDGGKQFLEFWKGMVKGPGVAKNSRFLAIQLAGRARHYNRPDFMMNAMALCAHYGYAVKDVMSSSQVLRPMPSTAEEYPAAMAAMLRNSSGYACGRCVVAGIATSVTNAIFEAAIMTKSDLDAAATDAAMQCCDVFGFGRSAYIHDQDVLIITQLITKVYSIEQEAEAITVVDAPSLVRICDMRMHCHVPCSVRAMVKFGGWPPRRGPRGVTRAPVPSRHAVPTCRAHAARLRLTNSVDRTTDSPCASAPLRVRPARRSAGESVVFLAAEYIPVGAPLPFDSLTLWSSSLGPPSASPYVSQPPQPPELGCTPPAPPAPSLADPVPSSAVHATDGVPWAGSACGLACLDAEDLAALAGSTDGTTAEEGSPCAHEDASLFWGIDQLSEIHGLDMFSCRDATHSSADAV